jgi:C-terminal binding protein
MGVGYDRIDRAVAAERGVIVCNVPDYGTAEVSDHAIALALGLSRGAFLHYDLQRGESPAGWQPVESSLLRRSSSTVYGIVGLGRIGMAAALKARALGSDVIFYDPGLPNGVEISLGLRRARKLDDLLTQAAILSLHVPLTPETRNMIGSREIALLPKGAIIINTARGPVLDLEAATAALRSGHLAGLGLDVLPVEPPAEPLPELVRAVRAREDWVLGRVVITPHIAFCSPDASVDVHRKAVETMHEVLTTGHSMNIIRPDQY